MKKFTEFLKEGIRDKDADWYNKRGYRVTSRKYGLIFALYRCED
jgi:hypothetical protein